MSLIVVQYRYDDRTELRMQHRPAHREYLKALYDEGKLLLTGPYADDGPPGALLILRAGSPAEALSWLDGDPLNVHGLIAERQARPYTQVFGPFPQD